MLHNEFCSSKLLPVPWTQEDSHFGCLDFSNVQSVVLGSLSDTDPAASLPKKLISLKSYPLHRRAEPPVAALPLMSMQCKACQAQAAASSPHSTAVPVQNTQQLCSRHLPAPQVRGGAQWWRSHPLLGCVPPHCRGSTAAAPGH